MKKRNFILGGGITGLVSAFYNSHCLVITDRIGQEGKETGPKILKHTRWTKKFIERLCEFTNVRDLVKRNYKCGYSIDNQIVGSATEAQKAAYLKKTRGKEWELFISSGMNDSENKVCGYCMKEIYWLLIHSTPIIEGHIHRLDGGEIEVLTKSLDGSGKSAFRRYKYDKIINTLPMKIYNKITGCVIESPMFEGGSEVYFYELKTDDSHFMDGYDFIYFPGEEVKFYRMTKTRVNTYLIESRVEIDSFPEGHKLINSYVLPHGKITRDCKPQYHEGTNHVGRYAMNNNNIRLHDVVELYESRLEKALNLRSKFDV